LPENISFFNYSFRLKGTYLLTAGNNLWLIINNNCLWILNLDGGLLKEKNKSCPTAYFSPTSLKCVEEWR
jgi:hypothetical protein